MTGSIRAFRHRRGVGNNAAATHALENDTGRMPLNERIKWKAPYAGFVSPSRWVYLADRAEEPFPCVDDDLPGHPKGCMETWNSVWTLPGETREEAEAAHAGGNHIGVAHHVSDCELLDDRPVEE